MRGIQIFATINDVSMRSTLCRGVKADILKMVCLNFTLNGENFKNILDLYFNDGGNENKGGNNNEEDDNNHDNDD